MSVASLCINVVNLNLMVPGKDVNGGNIYTPSLVQSNVPCNVQINGADTQPYYDAAQQRMIVPANVFFIGDGLQVEISGGQLLQQYQLVWLDGNNMLFRVKGYAEATLGRMLCWKASCEQVK